MAGIGIKKGGSNKRSMRPLANKRKRDSFATRYGMDRVAWRKFKYTESGIEIAKKRQEAYARFIKGAKVINAETYYKMGKYASI